jgi:hypothetical protein
MFAPRGNIRVLYALHSRSGGWKYYGFVEVFVVFKIRTTFILVAAVLMAAILSFAQDRPVLTQLLVVQENGKEVLKPVTSVSRGDVIEYRAEVVNTHTEGSLTNLNLDIPIPTGATVIVSSVNPKGASASADGKTFAAVPLKTKVQRGGAVIEEVVPASAYKVVRWSIPVLKPGARASVSVRCRIN